MAYGQIGPYPRNGYWLINKGGASALVRGDRLPAEGQGFEYYFLGTEYHQVKSRFSNAVGAFGFDVGNVQWSDQRWAESVNKGVSSNVTNPGGFSFTDALLYGTAGVALARLAAPLAVGGAARGGSAAEGGAAGGAAGSAGTKAAGSAVSKDLKAAGVIAGVAALISGYGLRLGEILAGAALILFGLYVLAKGEAPKLPVVG